MGKGRSNLSYRFFIKPTHRAYLAQNSKFQEIKRYWQNKYTDELINIGNNKINLGQEDKSCD